MNTTRHLSFCSLACRAAAIKIYGSLDVAIYLGFKGYSIFTVNSDYHDLSRCSGSPLVEHAFITNGCMLMLAPLLP